ncbi:class I SAM-dependent methyltransferase [Tepidiforma sp.]|uniref:class I SAM-dependent methyltransferase n=1 Tax=Tepidiforma sp. TaxID=2682230 RepID=UPI002ADDFEEC|nr:methyltransferase domain-containing protein [Tepidiforma sp.]
MTVAPTPSEAKVCCAAAYESEWARLLLGESFHPGGIDLTLHLGRQLRLGPGSRVLDVACGRGTSAIALAREFGCSVVGVDLSAANTRLACEAAQSAGVDHLASFVVGDAEALSFPDASFDAVLCECAFCTFPSKEAAAAEFARVLRPGGRLGLSDITRQGELPPELDTLLGWVACLADARPAEEYVALLSCAGFAGLTWQEHNDALASLASRVRFKLLGAEVMARLGKGPFAIEEVLRAKQIARVATASIREGRLGYAIITGNRD